MTWRAVNVEALLSTLEQVGINRDLLWELVDRTALVVLAGIVRSLHNRGRGAERPFLERTHNAAILEERVFALNLALVLREHVALQVNGRVFRWIAATTHQRPGSQDNGERRY